MRTREPSFFKILLDISNPQVRIPPLFVRRFGEKLQRNSVLQVNGSSWSVKIEEIDGCCCFAQGWRQFVKDNCLQKGDFLVFRLNQKSSFHVQIFDRSCCEKEVDSSIIHHNEDGGGDHPLPGRRKRVLDNLPMCPTTRSMPSERAKTDAAGREGPGNVHVKKEIKSEEDIVDVDKSKLPPSLSFTMEADQYCMAIPKDFALETGLVHKKRVVLVDPNGKRWLIDLRLRKDGRMKMNNGWDDFQKASKVAPGVACTFTFIKASPDIVLKVQVIRKRGRPRKMMEA